MEGRRVGKGSRGETCREGKWRGDTVGTCGGETSLGKGSGGETVCGHVEGRHVGTRGGVTCREGKWRGDVWEMQGRRVPSSGGETCPPPVVGRRVPSSGGETCGEVEGRHVGKGSGGETCRDSVSPPLP